MPNDKNSEDCLSTFKLMFIQFFFFHFKFEFNFNQGIFHIPDFVSRHFDEGRCIDPDRFPGVCKPLKECAVILSEFMAKSNDEAYIQYLRQSNNACHNMKPFVCCPPDGRKNQIPEQNIVGRLLKPTEGCGFSNQELRLKLAIGHQSKLGDLRQINCRQTY